MGVGDWDDLEGAFDRAVMDSPVAEPIEYTPKDGATITEAPSGEDLRGIFDPAPVDVDAAGVPIGTRSPEVQILLSDLAGHRPRKADVVRIVNRDEYYTVAKRNRTAPDVATLVLGWLPG